MKLLRKYISTENKVPWFGYRINIEEAAGASFEKVVKTTVFLKDMGDFKAFNEEYTVAFNPEKNPPARSTVAVAGLPLGALVEIEAIVQL